MANYDALSPNYHWLYSDERLSGRLFLEDHGDWLASLPPGARILDCACGTGIHATTLARHGFSVQGTDISPGMVAQARLRAKEEGHEEPNPSFTVSPWRELAGRFPHEFHVALCVGNSIGHCRSAEDMLASLRGIRGALEKNAMIVLDSRNWEKLYTDRVRFMVLGSRVRNGVRCIPVYAWNFPPQGNGKFPDNELPGEISVEVLLIFQEAGALRHEYFSPIVYYPFSFHTLRACLGEAGFTDIQSDFARDKAVYRVIARNR